MPRVLEQVAERGEIIVPLVTVHAVIDGDIPNISLGKEALGIAAYFQIVTTHAGHIFDNNGLTFPASASRIISFQPGRSNVTPDTPSSMKNVGLEKMIVRCVFEQDFLLERDLSRVFSLLKHSICHAANNCLIFSLG